MHRKNTVFFYILFAFLNEFAFVYAVYAIIFKDHGLDFIEISVLLTVWSVSSLLFEIPSGIVADLWSRKLMIFIALLVKAAGFLVWLVFPHFIGFAAGFVLWGASGAFCSGTLEALLFDALKLEGREDSFVRVTGIGRTASGIAVAAATAVGGFLFRYSQEAVLLLSAAFMVAAGFCVLPIPEDRTSYRRQPDEEESFPRSIRELIRLSGEMLSNGDIFALVLFGSVAGSAYGVLDEFDSLFGTSIGVPVSFIGLWVAGRFILESSGGLIAPLIEKRFIRDRPRKLALFTAAGGVMLFLGTLHAYLLPLYFLFYQVLATAEILYQGSLQKRLESAGRATLSSLAGFVYTLSGILLGLLFGFIAELYGLKIMFMTGGSVVVASAAVYGVFSRKKTARARRA